MLDLLEPMPELFAKSKVLILDFSQIPATIPESENIETFFKLASEQGDNPRLPERRQAFNNRMLDASGYRYLVGRYGEDRIAMLADTPAGKSGRTIHMALDIFSKDLEPVNAPCDGEIVMSDYEPGFGEYGNYIIMKPQDAD